MNMIISKTKVMEVAQNVALKEAAVDPCSVCGEGVRELNPLCNMWLLGARAMFGNVRKFKLAKLPHTPEHNPCTQ